MVPHELVGFDNPFNCKSSCGCSVVFFLLHREGLPYCNFQLITNMQDRQNTKVEECTKSLNYFAAIGVVEKEEILKVITETYAVQEALNDIRKLIEELKRPLILGLQYVDQDLEGHCVAIMSDGFTVIDVQNKQYWTFDLNKPISHIHVIKLTKNAVDNWLDYCGIGSCVS